MNRITIAAVLIGAAAAAPSWAAGVLPGIGGSVTQLESADPVDGVHLKLFLDDGDGVFDVTLDSIVAGMNTDANGMYQFDDLNPILRYFVQRPSQEILGIAQPGEVSGLLAPFQSSLTIDEFDNHQTVHANPITPAATSSLNDPGSSVLGYERDIYVELLGGIGEVSLRSKAFGVNVSQYDTSSGVQGRGVITWDGIDGSGSLKPSLGLGNIDLTMKGDATGLLFKTGIDRTGEGEKLVIRLFKDSADEYSEASALIPITDGTATASAFIPYNSFVGSVDPTDINAIQMWMGEASKSIDAQIESVVSVGPTSQNFAVVPEPAALLIFLLGFLGILSFTRS
ncbi:MAG: hypothetical protein GY768_08350 [Planctomycetaceae bacterium]|nr:hypothetical protein [Planctomycetaceae bacterium]